MTNEEKKLLQEVFKLTKEVFYRNKVHSDILEWIQDNVEGAKLPAKLIARIKSTDSKITDIELKKLEDKIANL